jgi:proteasome lid subunit RPN8/RPN11
LGLRIDEDARERLLAHCRDELPNEGCGLLLGAQDRVLEVAPARNVAAGDRRREFEVDPRDFVEADSLARERGLEIIGSYHSHPQRAAEPSEADRAAAQAGWWQLIVGRPASPVQEWRCFRLSSGLLREEAVSGGGD